MTRFLPFGSRSKTIQVNTLGGGAPAVTYATWNPANIGSNMTLSGGDLSISNSSGSWNTGLATIGKTTGKWYWEYTITGAGDKFPWAASSTFNVSGTPIVGQQQYSIGYRETDGTKSFYSGSWQITAYGSSYTSGDVISIAIDYDAGTTEFYKNGVSQGVAYTIPANAEMTAAVSINIGSVTANFGATAFAYSVPTGYNAGLYT